MTPEQADAAAASLVAEARANSMAERIASAKSVPFCFRSPASKQLDRWQEWVAYRQASSQPFHRHPLLVGVMVVCIALVLLLFWRAAHPIPLSVYLLGLVLLAVPHAIRVWLIRVRLERIASSQRCSSVVER